MKDWKHRASCLYHDPALFDTERLYGPDGARRMRAREVMAKTICATCPVREECAEYGVEVAIEFDAIEQIYGGYTPKELAAAVGSRLTFVSGIQTFRDSMGRAAL